MRTFNPFDQGQIHEQPEELTDKQHRMMELVEGLLSELPAVIRPLANQYMVSYLPLSDEQINEFCDHIREVLDRVQYGNDQEE